MVPLDFLSSSSRSPSARRRSACARRCHAGAAILRQLYPAYPAFPPDWAVLAGLGTALLTGSVFGVLPARLDPVQSLAKR